MINGADARLNLNHHFKRARWRRLWRQQIQDYLIAAIQNVRLLLRHAPRKSIAAATGVVLRFENQPQRPLFARFSYLATFLPIRQPHF
jgi:hypothetical protein